MAFLLQGILWILAILVILPAALIAAAYLKKVRPASTPSATTGSGILMTGKAVKLGLVLAGYLLVYWWIDWSKNPLGKAVIGITGPISSRAEALLPWALYWTPILVGLLWAVRLLLNKGPAATAATGGEGRKTALLTLLIVTVVIAAFLLGKNGNGEVDPIKVDLHNFQCQDIEVPLEPKKREILIDLPNPTSMKVPRGERLQADGISDFYFCAVPQAKALRPASAHGLALQELPGNNPYSYTKRAEVNPSTRNFADEFGIPVVKMSVCRVKRVSGQYSCP